ncbi:hypothetical protein HDV06_006568 [Boothiomyces sp. JEL0866]|nr:hypothetical protein HDV06_006568 [Boothiomyces sp. JEL0866]
MKCLFFQLLSVAALTYSTVDSETTTTVSPTPPTPTPTVFDGSHVNRTHHSHFPWSTPPPVQNPQPVPAPPPPNQQGNQPDTSNQNQNSNSVHNNNNNKPIQITSISVSANNSQISNTGQNQVGQINQVPVDGNPISSPSSTPTNTTPSDGMNSSSSLTSTAIILISFGLSVFLVIAAVFGVKTFQAKRKADFSFSSGDSKQSFSRADSPPLPSPIYETEFNFTEQDRIPIDLNMFLPNKPITPSPLANAMHISTLSGSSTSS